MISPGVHWVQGWHHSNSNSRAFRAGDYEQSARKEAGEPEEPYGAVTVVFHTALQEGVAPPEDEASVLAFHTETIEKTLPDGRMVPVTVFVPHIETPAVEEGTYSVDVPNTESRTVTYTVQGPPAQEKTRTAPVTTFVPEVTSEIPSGVPTPPEQVGESSDRPTYIARGSNLQTRITIYKGVYPGRIRGAVSIFYRRPGM